MSNLLYAIAAISFILWAIGFIGYNLGGMIHIFIVIAIVLLMIRAIEEKRRNIF
jgi:uncharacterized membrane protein